MNKMMADGANEWAVLIDRTLQGSVSVGRAMTVCMVATPTCYRQIAASVR